MSDIIDPLKFHTYGLKKPLEGKQQVIQDLYDNDKRYYPMGKDGVLDEWGAVIRKQSENYQREQEEAAVRKQFMQKKYGEELQKNIQHKEMQKQMDQYQKQQEAERMQKNVQLKATLEMMERQQREQKQGDLNNHFQNVIGYNNQQKNAIQSEQSNIDKYIVQRDLNDYDKYLKAQAERKHWQRSMMNQELEQSIKLKNAIRDKERSIDRMADDYKSLGGIGQNYDLQKQKQARVEEYQRQQQDRYQSQVYSPNRQKLEQQKQLELRDFADVRQRYDNEKQYIERQKHQARQLNYQQLKMQQDEQHHIKQLNDTQDFNKNQARLQALHNQKMENFELDQRKNQQQQYKDMLDQQLEVKNSFKMYGNMSSVEKNINKVDLNAFKNYDTRQYSLVPGLQHSKHVKGPGPLAASGEQVLGPPSPGGSKNPMEYEERYNLKQTQLKQIGYNDRGQRYQSGEPIRNSQEYGAGGAKMAVTPLSRYSNPITARNHHLSTRNRVLPTTDFHKIDAQIQSRGQNSISQSGSHVDQARAAGQEIRGQADSRGRPEFMQGNPSAPNIYHTSGSAIPRHESQPVNSRGGLGSFDQPPQGQQQPLAAGGAQQYVGDYVGVNQQ